MSLAAARLGWRSPGRDGRRGPRWGQRERACRRPPAVLGRDGGRSAHEYQVLLDQVDAFDPNSQIGLAIADLGSGIRCSFADALVLRAGMQGADDLDERAAREAMRVIASRGDRVFRDGKVAESEEDVLEVVREKVRKITTAKFPVWQKLLPQLWRA